MRNSHVKTANIIVVDNVCHLIDIFNLEIFIFGINIFVGKFLVEVFF